jgi:hypothetical protein
VHVMTVGVGACPFLSNNHVEEGSLD